MSKGDRVGWRKVGIRLAALSICLLSLVQPAPVAAGEDGGSGWHFPDGEGDAGSRAGSLNLTVSFDKQFYTPNASVVISGQVSDQDGDGVGAALVAAELWGGLFLGETVTAAPGNYSLAFQAPGLPGNYTVNVTARHGGLSDRAAPILRVIPGPDEAPRIDGFSRTPANVTASDDVLVSADVSDDFGVRNVTLAYRATGPAYTLVAMNATAPGRYTSSIPRQPENALVEFYIEARDALASSYYPPGAPALPASYTVLRHDPARHWVRLFASLNSTVCLVGRPLLATGYVRNETGGPVAGARVELAFEGPAPAGVFRAETDGRGVFQLDAAAPPMPGNYTVNVRCTFGSLINRTETTLSVRDVLTVRLYADRSSVEASRRLAVTGTVFRLDGSPASNATVRLAFEGSKFWWDCRVDANGRYCATVQAPARSGSYMLNATATFSNIEGTAGLRIAVLDRPRQSPWGGAPLLLAAAALALAFAAYARSRAT